MLKLLDSISFLSIVAIIVVFYIYANDEGIKEIHDNIAVYIEKPKEVEVVVEEVKDPPLYILQASKSI